MGNTTIAIVFMLLLMPAVCPLGILAQAPPQPNLPDGAKARLNTSDIFDIAYSPDGKRLAIAHAGGIRTFDTSGYRETAFLTGHTAEVTSVAFCPTGGLLASGSRDNTVRLWNPLTGEHKRSLTGHAHWVLSVSFSPDGLTLASGSDGERDGGSIFGAEIRLWDTETGAHKRTLTARGSVSCVAFRPDGGSFAGGEGWPEYAVRIWDAATGAQIHALTGHTDWVEGIAFSPDGERLASTSWDATIRLWDTGTGTHKQTLTGHTGGVGSVAFSPDGRTLASGGMDNSIRLWDAPSGTHKRTLTGHTSNVVSVAFSPDGSEMGSGSSDGVVFFWDTAAISDAPGGTR